MNTFKKIKISYIFLWIIYVVQLLAMFAGSSLGNSDGSGLGQSLQFFGLIIGFIISTVPLIFISAYFFEIKEKYTNGEKEISTTGYYIFYVISFVVIFVMFLFHMLWLLSHFGILSAKDIEFLF
jgi:uncharacterized membrane protein